MDSWDRRQFENWSTKLINITHTRTQTQAGRTKTGIEHIERTVKGTAVRCTRDKQAELDKGQWDSVKGFARVKRHI